MSRRPVRKPLRAIFAMPLAIALLSIMGLVSALTGDGIRDAISWVTLAVPVIVIGWALKYRKY
ncbi:hypothetical protein [Sphingobium boeckii]|uniref:Putative membrane protein n=1 Tax=Sphingobium boeckii TaxID=1082345 RepID=A0A7W9AJG4_9SPHN|nr:hypothetical protein [Sphingobium boeckii]MBB5686562.1 putative membrane protein [Sphingobium boeckii]